MVGVQRGSHVDIFFLCPVKLKIKSFKVPELYIEIPETATVGSLKVFLITQAYAILFQQYFHIICGLNIVHRDRLWKL